MEKKGEICGLAHIGLFVADRERSVKFYTEVLEFGVIWECELEGPCKIAFIRNGDCTIEVVQRAEGANSGDGVVDHIAMRVRNIEAMQQKLIERGVEFETAEPVFDKRVFPNGAKWLMFRGPDGEHLEISEVM